MHYLDNAATTKPSPAAIAAALDAMERNFGNPSSVHALGIEAERIVGKARKDIASALGCRSENIIFTSGGTESTNLALKGSLLSKAHRGGHIITTAIEHSATLNTVKYLADTGYAVSFLNPEKDGSINLDALKSLIRPDTVLLSMMLVNNETGALLPVGKASELYKSLCPNGLVHCDAVQGFMKTEFTVKSLGADFISISAHKVHGLKGSGALYVKNINTLKPILHGGGHEGGLRAGTEAVPAVAAFGAAVAEAAEHKTQNLAQIEVLRNRFLSGIGKIEGVRLIAAGSAIINIAVPAYPSEVLIRLLERDGVYLSGGSACAKGRSSHVLEAMQLPSALLKSALRVSFSWTNTIDDVDAALAAIARIAERHTAAE